MPIRYLSPKNPSNDKYSLQFYSQETSNPYAQLLEITKFPRETNLPRRTRMMGHGKMDELKDVL
jgi:hypothetical protein